MSYILGLTGPTGAGKGIFSDCAKELGFNVVDCDAVARAAVKKGMPALCALTDAFGSEILLENGELDRKKLALLAFSSPDKTELLNKTVLPFIKELVLKKINGDFVLLDAPTLFESGIDKICDLTVAVLAPAALRKARIIERDALDETAAQTRLSAGKPDEFYNENADYVFLNDETIENFKKKVKIYLSDIIGGTYNE
ncbi:MAG: dephospho-CoA kinase [Clostridia bacterium]|nr:dephospho-CoA kinase [Clostridia bacterium]